MQYFPEDYVIVIDLVVVKCVGLDRRNEFSFIETDLLQTDLLAMNVAKKP